HGLLGALAAQAVSRPEKIRYAAGIGLVAALLPDADVLIRSAQDPLLTLSYHRHFTHSLLFVPVIAFVAALLCWPLVRKQLTGSGIYLCALAGAATAGILDACT